jgi:superfamily II DNA or RNA helicase
VSTTAPAAGTVPIGGPARELIAAAERLRARSDAALTLSEGRKRAARALYERARDEIVREQLARMPIERLKDTTEGRLRLGPLEGAGIATVGQALAEGRARLLRLPGIGDQSAQAIIGAARQVEAALRDSVRLRIDADGRPALHAELLAALAAVHETEARIGPLREDFERVSAGLATALPQALPTRSRLRMLFAGGGRRQQAQTALAHVRDSLAWAEHNDLTRILAALDLPPLPADALWSDYERRAAHYNGLLIEISGQTPDEQASQGFLPTEIAERVAAHPLDLRLLGLSLRGYQAFGARFALAQRRAILGDEMGLGKTVEALAAMCHLSSADAATHFLVVCPASVVVNWTHETERHTDLPALRLHGDERDRNVAQWARQGGVGVTTFESLRRLAKPPGVNVDLLVVDEAHFVKNPEAQRTRAVRRWIAHADRVLFMSGTPMENRVDEFRTLVSHLSPEVAAGVALADGARGSAGFRAAVAPVYLRRNQVDVLSELPPRIDIEDWVELSRDDDAAYRDAVTSENFMAMRRAAYMSKRSAKLERVVEIVDEAMADGRKVVVFSFFLDVLAQVAGALGGHVIGELTGAVSPAARQLVIDEFTAHERPKVLLSQIESGGVGLNIQAASVVILCEPQWKPSTEDQAIARCHRMGQARTVTVHRILAEDTVDRSMRTVLASKGLLFDEYVRRSELKELSPEAVDVSSVAEAARTATQAEHERRIIEFERRRLGVVS